MELRLSESDVTKLDDLTERRLSDRSGVIRALINETHEREARQARRR